MRIDEADFRQTAYDHLACLSVFLERNGTELIEFNLRIILCYDRSVCSGITSHTTGVECTESQLSSRLTDSLCSDDTDSLTLLNHAAGCEVASVALHADTMLTLTREHRANLNTLYRRIFNLLCDRLCDFLTCSNNQFACGRMDDIMYRHAAQDALIQRGDGLVTILESGTYQSAQRAAVFFRDNHIVRNINKTTCQVTGIGSLHRRIGKTLTGTVRSNEVFEYRHTFLEV